MQEKNGSSRPLSTKQSPSFFKIYLPELHSDKIPIPPNFINNFNGTLLSEKATLRNLSGKVWPVKLEKITGTLFLTTGWKNYTADHSLIRGNLLVFTYLGNSDFSVKVFGLNGCIMEEPVEENGDEIRRFEAKGDMKLDQKGISQLKRVCFVKNFCNKLNEYVGLPTHVVRECNVKAPQDIRMRNRRGDLIRAKVRKLTDRVALRSSELREFWKKNKVQCGDKLRFEVVFGNEGRIEDLFVDVQKNKSRAPGAK